VEVRIRNAKLKLVIGDITEQDVEAIVNSANDRFWMGSGVAGVIKKKGGEQIELDAMRQGPVIIGEVVVTGAGTLPFKNIIHAAVMGQDLVTSKDAIENATENIIRKADELKLKSVAIPALGTGVGHFPAEESADAIIKYSIDGLLDTKHIQEIRIVLSSQGIYNIFEQKLRAKFSR